MTTSNCQTRPVFKRIYGKEKEKRIDETNKTGAQQQNKKIQFLRVYMEAYIQKKKKKK